MSRDFCCHGDCNQGRTCPHRPAKPPTRREWLLTVGALVAALVLSFILSGCKTERAKVLDGAVLWEKSGCAFIAHANAGDTMWLTRIAELDRAGCRAGDYVAVKP